MDLFLDHLDELLQDLIEIGEIRIKKEVIEIPKLQNESFKGIIEPNKKKKVFIKLLSFKNHFQVYSIERLKILFSSNNGLFILGDNIKIID